MKSAVKTSKYFAFWGYLWGYSDLCHAEKVKEINN